MKNKRKIKDTRPESLKSSRNWLAVVVFFKSGAGTHGKSGYTRKVKHKGKETE
jgi:hypothetical protein